MSSDGIPLDEGQRTAARHLGRLCVWLGWCTTGIGVAMIAEVVWVVIQLRGLLPTGAFGGIAAVVIAGVLLVVQGAAARAAGKAFAELAEEPFASMAALALSKVGRYFAVDATVFWLPPLGLLATCGFVMVAG